jgi:plastocyanin
MIGVAALCLACCAPASGQSFDLSGHVDVIRHSTEPSHLGSSEVLVWLTPLEPLTPQPVVNHPAYALTQKDKQFSPHLLVVPVGSSVDFPNLDPFFHNVFSLFNGKRFDLGLYEGHSHRSVQFDREGVSFIFCNIHPDMGAVIVALKTPFYAISTVNGTLSLPSVPRGKYRLNVWAEDATVEQLNALSRIVEVGPQHTGLGSIRVETTGNTMKHHTNKFGDAYKPLPHVPY